MKKTLTLVITAVILLSAVMMITSCSQWDSPYNKLDKDGYTVSVKFDPGIGIFADTNGVTMVDVFDASSIESGNGVKLLAPDDSARGVGKAFKVSCTGHTFAGWYKATEDANGNLIPDLTAKWDFSKDTLNSSYLSSTGETSNTPVLTLVAAWIPYPTFTIHSVNEDGTTSVLDKIIAESFTLPVWTDKGTQNLGNIPAVKGKTFLNAYTDAECTTPIEVDENNLIWGKYNEDKTQCLTPNIDIYTTWEVGEWFMISSAKQLYQNAKPNGCYRLTTDIDFSNTAWPTVFKNGFNGTIESTEGNSFKITGINVSNDTSAASGAIFGTLGESACFNNVSFEDVTFTFNGTIRQNSTFAMFATSINENAVFENFSVNGTLIIARAVVDEIALSRYLGTLSLGLMIPEGNVDSIEGSVECKFDNGESIEASENGTIDLTVYLPEEAN